MILSQAGMAQDVLLKDRGLCREGSALVILDSALEMVQYL